MYSLKKQTIISQRVSKLFVRFLRDYDVFHDFLVLITIVC